MKHTRQSSITILAAAMIAILLLIPPVLGYAPPGGGGSSSGSSSGSGSGSSSGTSQITYSSTVSTGTFTLAGEGWYNSEIKNNPPVARISIETKTSPDQNTQDPAYTIAVMSETKTNEVRQQAAGGSKTGGSAMGSGQVISPSPLSWDALGILAGYSGFNAPLKGTHGNNLGEYSMNKGATNLDTPLPQLPEYEPGKPAIEERSNLPRPEDSIGDDFERNIPSVTDDMALMNALYEKSLAAKANGR